MFQFAYRYGLANASAALHEFLKNRYFHSIGSVFAEDMIP